MSKETVEINMDETPKVFLLLPSVGDELYIHKLEDGTLRMSLGNSNMVIKPNGSNSFSLVLGK